MFCFPDLFNFQNVNLIDILTFIATAALGIGAIIIAVKSNAISENTMKHEAEMRKLENKISVLDKAYEVYNYFNKEITKEGYFAKTSDAENYLKSAARLDEIEYLTRFLFKDETYDKIELEIVRVGFALIDMHFPNIKSRNTNYKCVEDVVAEFDDTINPDIDEVEYKRRKELFFAVISKNIEDAFREYRLNL